ncbi:MAG: hypothetical protein ACTIM4_11010 [Marinomonas sp.]
MKKVLLSTLVISLLSTTAYASVKDKKAMKAADAHITTEIVKVKAACGNPSLDVKVNWDAYEKMISANTDKLAKDNYKSEWVLSHSGQRTVATLEAMAKICKSDADYKEELAKVSKIEVAPKADFKDSKNVFSLKGSTMTVEAGHKMTRKADDFVKPIKALF